MERTPRGPRKTHVAVDETDDLRRRDVLGEENGVARLRAAVSANEEVPPFVCASGAEYQQVGSKSWRVIVHEPVAISPARGD